MKELSKIAMRVNPSTTLAIDSLAKQMKADGLDVISFGTGEPDFMTPENISEAGIAAIREGKTKYTPAAGIVQLREAAAERLKADCGLDYDYTQIVIASGAKHNVYAALRVLLDPGDEVIVPAPYWVSYCEMVSICGGVPVVVETAEAAGFKMAPAQLEAAITPRTKALILNNPSNPTGMVYTEAELRAIAEVCVKYDLYVIADEIYYKLMYDGKPFVSFASLGGDVKERTIVVNGVSKSYAMTGWRIGFAAASREITQVMNNYLSHSLSGTCSIAQAAAAEAFGGPQEEIEAMRQAFETRRNYLYDRMSQIPGVHPVRSEATFYMLMNLSQLIGKTLYGVEIHDADDFANVFLKEGLVAVVPCTGFGAPHYVRWSFAVSMENIKEGMDRLEKFLKNA